MAGFLKHADLVPLPANPEAATQAELSRLFANAGKDNVATVRQAMQESMMDKCGVFRTADSLHSVQQDLAACRSAFGALA